MTTAQLEAQLLKLPRSARAHLARVLITSLDEEAEIGKAWVKEANTRYQAYLNGNEEVLPLEDVMAAIRQELIP